MGQTIGLTTVTARKSHDCEWCKDGIQPGDEYEKWIYKDGGDVAFLKAHVECLAVIDRLRDEHGHLMDEDEFPCSRNDHRKGHGCADCDPDNEGPNRAAAERSTGGTPAGGGAQ